MQYESQTIWYRLFDELKYVYINHRYYIKNDSLYTGRKGNKKYMLLKIQKIYAK